METDTRRCSGARNDRSGPKRTSRGRDRRHPDAGATVSNVNRPWLIRIVIITACLLGYAGWSLYDAFVAYPARGASYSSFAEWKYLGLATEADRTESPGVLRREGAVADPVTELAELKANRADNETARQGGSRQKRAAMEIAREDWLNSLKMIGRLHPAYTNFYRTPDESAAEELAATEDTSANAETIAGLRSRLTPVSPRDRFTELNTRWSSESPPGPLRSYDIPVNKIQALICIAFGVYLISLFVRVASRTYRWDPQTRSMTLPSGETIAPAELDDVDKRKWDKFIVFLRIKDSHSQLGGKEIRFDTYRHGRVEGWILEMEKAAFPDRETKPETGADASEEPADTERAAAG
jgi:hypothetical protein